MRRPRFAGEPGCAVAGAVARDEITDERLQSYQKLQREFAYLDRKQDARAQSKENRKIKSIMKAARKSMRHHPKYNQ